MATHVIESVTVLVQSNQRLVVLIDQGACLFVDGKQGKGKQEPLTQSPDT